jgi:spore coat protein A
MHGGGVIGPDGEAPSPSVLPEFFGDHILVNGAAWPFVNVEPRKYRLRLLNGSDSRFYNLRINAGLGQGNGPQIVQIGSDGGLLDSPVYLDRLLLAPGERADVIVDFSGFAGQNLLMRNNARSPFPKGETADPQTVGRIVQFRVGTTVTEPDLPIPATLRPAPIQPLGPTAPTRKLMLFEGEDRFDRLQPMLGIVDPSNANDGTLLWDQPITEKMQFDATEVWEIYNGTADAHPIHLHLVQFQVLGRQKFRGEFSEKELPQGSTGATLSDIRLLGQQKLPELNERGWKDTVIMYPGEVTRIVAKFDRAGEYVWHCHILSHEDNEMMRPFLVESPTAIATAIQGAASAVAQPNFSAGRFSARPISLLRDSGDENRLEELN